MTCRVLGRSFRSLAWRWPEWKLSTTAYFVPLAYAGIAYGAAGQVPRSNCSPSKAGGIEDRIAASLAELAHAYAASGRRAEARQALEELLARFKTGHVSKYLIATVYAALGDKNEALTRLEQRIPRYLGFLKSDPELDSLRSELRFQDLVRRMNFPP